MLYWDLLSRACLRDCQSKQAVSQTNRWRVSQEHKEMWKLLMEKKLNRNKTQENSLLTTEKTGAILQISKETYACQTPSGVTILQHHPTNGNLCAQRGHLNQKLINNVFYRLLMEVSQNMNAPWLLYPLSTHFLNSLPTIAWYLWYVPKQQLLFRTSLHPMGIWCSRVHQSRATDHKNNLQGMQQKTASSRVALVYASLHIAGTPGYENGPSYPQQVLK